MTHDFRPDPEICFSPHLCKLPFQCLNILWFLHSVPGRRVVFFVCWHFSGRISNSFVRFKRSAKTNSTKNTMINTSSRLRTLQNVNLFLFTEYFHLKRQQAGEALNRWSIYLCFFLSTLPKQNDFTYKSLYVQWQWQFHSQLYRSVHSINSSAFRSLTVCDLWFFYSTGFAVQCNTTLTFSMAIIVMIQQQLAHRKHSLIFTASIGPKAFPIKEILCVQLQLHLVKTENSIHFHKYTTITSFHPISIYPCCCC